MHFCLRSLLATSTLPFQRPRARTSTMGVPKFYRWLSERYPLINQVVKESVSKPEFDCLYLDMNGIIHNCTHSDKLDPTIILTNDQMMTKIFQYIEKLFDIIKPKKLMYMAIDGVAPRAKMNQQRQRRFRAALDAAQQREERVRAGDKFNADDLFDSNCITPGTEFMAALSEHLKYFIRMKLKQDASWQRCRVIFSGHEVPGEGEHKIVNYIRGMKMQPDYNPNLRHCMYGLDADLIMLALITHEPHFALLREEVVFGGANKHTAGNGALAARKLLVKMDAFQLLHISILRQYIDLEFRDIKIPFPYSLERIIDDLVFLCFFVGNDFLPHMPALDIAEGGLDNMFAQYKLELPLMQTYITDQGNVDLASLERMTRRMALFEASIFQKREDEANGNGRRGRGKRVSEQETSFQVDADLAAAVERASLGASGRQIDEDEAVDAQFEQQLQELKASGAAAAHVGRHDDYASKYYRAKFGDEFLVDPESRRMLARSFIEGMLWVYAYYYQGVCSWKWFFPYYYAPLNCDLVDLPTMAPFHFELGLPNTPLEQLLGVLPAASAKLLPVPLQRLMTDPYSPIIDFYPTSFEIDMNGKKNAWEGIAMIPFVDARRLNTALNSLDLRGVLSSREFTRNQFGDELLFVYAPDNEKETIQSTMPRTFPTLVRAQSRMSVFQCPAIPPPGRFVPKLCDGVLQPFAGFPSLTQPSMHVTGQLAKIAVNVFGRASGKETLLIAVGDSDAAAVLGVSSGADTEKALAGAADRLGALEEVPTNVGSLYPTRSESWRRARLSFAIGARAARRWLGGVHAPNQAAGATCFVQWPIVREAMVTRISTLSGHLFSLHEKYPVYNMPADDVARFAADADAEQERARTTRGVDIGPVYAMAHVRVLRGMRRAADGSIRRYFGEEGDDEEVVPLQLILPERPARPDPRFIDLRPTSMRDAFSLGAEVVYIGGERPELYGSIGQVTGYSADDESRALSVRMTGQAPEPAFGAQIARSVRETMRYYPAYQCARRLGITAQTLGKLTSSIFVQPARIDIGLNLKLQKQNLLVPGYARRSNLPQAWEELTGARTNPMTADSENTDALGGWDYSEATIALIEQYRAKYPRVFELLETYPNEYSYSCDALVSTNGDSDEEDEVTAKGSDEEDDESERVVIASPTRSRQSRSVRGKNRAAAISAWLKTLPSARLMLIPGSSSILPLEACDAIEKAADAYKQKEVDAKPDVDMDNVPMVYLYRTTPVVHWSPSETGSFTLGDRVAALRSDTGVAFGARGVCVGIHHLDSTHSNVYAGVAQSQRGLLLEVLWDEAVLSGTTLNGRCSERRGTFALPADVLNLSRPRVPMVRQAPNANAPSSVADVQRSYAQHQQKHQPKQQQQKAVQQVKIAARPTSAAVPFAAVVNGASASAPVAAEAETPVESKKQQNKNQKQSKQKQPATQQQPQQPVKIAARPAAAVPVPVVDSESTPDAPPPLAAAKPVSLPTVPPLLADMLAKAKAAAAQNSQNDVSGMLKAMLKISENAPVAVAVAASAAAPSVAPAQTQPAQNQQPPQNYPRQPQQMPGYPAMPFPPQMMYGSPYPHPQFMPPHAMYPPQPMPGYSPFAAAAEPGQNAHAAVLNALPQGVRQQMEREMRGGK